MKNMMLKFTSPFYPNHNSSKCGGGPIYINASLIESIYMNSGVSGTEYAVVQVSGHGLFVKESIEEVYEMYNKAING